MRKMTNSIDCADSFPPVSIVIAVRNEIEHLEDCLLAITELDYPKNVVEIVLVDGMSDDGSSNILSSWQARDNRIRVMSNPQKSASAGMNLGIAAANHELILWISGHVILRQDHLRKCYQAMVDTGAAAVGGVLTTRGTTTIGRINAAVLSHPFGVGGGKHRIGGSSGWEPVVTMALYRKAAILEAGGFNESLPRSQDNDLHNRMNEIGQRSYLNTEVNSTYLCRNTLGGLLRQAWNNGYWNIVLTLKGHGGFSPRHFVPLAFVLAQLVVLIAGLVYQPLLLVLAACLSIYAVIAVIASIHAAIRNRLSWQVVALPFWFASLHYTYGAASLTALLSRRRLQKS
jgi:glycosyltransferase involved in cell wall biosynthesis